MGLFWINEWSVQVWMIYGSCFPYALDVLSTYTLFMTSANGNIIVSVDQASSLPYLYLQGYGWLSLSLTLYTGFVSRIYLVSLPIFTRTSPGQTSSWHICMLAKGPSQKLCLQASLLSRHILLMASVASLNSMFTLVLLDSSFSIAFQCTSVSRIWIHCSYKFASQYSPI